MIRFFTKEQAVEFGATHKIHKCYTDCDRGCIRSCFIYLKNEDGTWYDLRDYGGNRKKWWPGSAVTADYQMSMGKIVFEINTEDRICYEFMVKCGKKLDSTVGPPCGHGIECYDICQHRR